MISIEGAQKNANRNARIVIDMDAGMSLDALSSKYGLAPTSIHHLGYACGARRKRPVYIKGRSRGSSKAIIEAYLSGVSVEELCQVHKTSLNVIRQVIYKAINVLASLQEARATVALLNESDAFAFIDRVFAKAIEDQLAFDEEQKALILERDTALLERNAAFTSLKSLMAYNAQRSLDACTGKPKSKLQAISSWFDGISFTYFGENKNKKGDSK